MEESSSLLLDELVTGVGALLVVGGEGGPLRVGARVEITTGPTTTSKGMCKFEIIENVVKIVSSINRL